MEYVGVRVIFKRLQKMLTFCGQYRCQMDANGRLKLNPQLIDGFMEQNAGKIVMHCLPEGAVAVYPENTYLEMRKNEQAAAAMAADSVVFRRKMRRFGALSSSARISEQGRLTVPQGFRDYGLLCPGEEVLVVGVEIGIELWSVERWNAELEKMDEHANAKGASEMAGDLLMKE